MCSFAHLSQRRQYFRLRRLSSLMAMLRPDVDIIRRCCHAAEAPELGRDVIWVWLSGDSVYAGERWSSYAGSVSTVLIDVTSVLGEPVHIRVAPGVLSPGEATAGSLASTFRRLWEPSWPASRSEDDWCLLPPPRNHLTPPSTPVTRPTLPTLFAIGVRYPSDVFDAGLETRREVLGVVISRCRAFDCRSKKWM